MTVGPLHATILGTILLSYPALSRPVETLLTSFPEQEPAFSPGALLYSGGTLYGVTERGGSKDDGTVFALSPPAPGHTDWTRSILFTFDGKDGSIPYARLVADSSGALYSITAYGGTNNTGTIFKLSPPVLGSTTWTETVLFSFNVGTDGGYPTGGLTFDSDGNLYGTTSQGGPSGGGTVFKLTPPSAGNPKWTEATIYSFDPAMGGYPGLGTLIFNRDGELFGTTRQGTNTNDGIVYKLSPPTAGALTWTEKVLFVFDGLDGQLPYGGVIADQQGALYGTTMEGGVQGLGVVFKLARPARGATYWTETILHNFNGKDGESPEGDLVIDPKGAVFGIAGGGAKGNGLVYKLAPAEQGQDLRFETILHAFKGTANDGQYPSGGLAQDSVRTLFGITGGGGADNSGTAFQIQR